MGQGANFKLIKITNLPMLHYVFVEGPLFFATKGLIIFDTFLSGELRKCSAKQFFFNIRYGEQTGLTLNRQKFTFCYR